MTVVQQIQQLLSQKWAPLERNLTSLEGARCIGVYLLAYSNEDMAGRKINLEDIFYVGMSNARGGVKSRLGQFLDGIETGKSHSGAMRFFKTYLEERPFSRAKTGKRFFVAITTFPCVVEKSKRTAKDLRKMGDVARLEYYVIAYIKEALGREPELNKK
ncbi:MAG: hypothetical protein HZC40_02635 [Chloroflexi bacterium]|nr:hypothetical protein [Chloroflexota bacterium]